MKTFETTFITLDSGISVWLSPNASPAEVEALLKNALSYETRKVVRAEDGFTLKRGDTDLGSQVWLQDSMSIDDIQEVAIPPVSEDPEDV